MRTKLIASAFALLLAFGVVACEEPADVENDFEGDGVEDGGGLEGEGDAGGEDGGLEGEGDAGGEDGGLEGDTDSESDF